MQLQDKKILLVISGGIAAYKALDLIRLLKKSGAQVQSILTKGGAEFITPLSVSALSGHDVYTDLFSLKDEAEMGHIRLSRESDLIVVAPCSANLMAKIAHGRADDLAAATLLAANKPILIAPAMNPQMWNNAATQENFKTLKQNGIFTCDPEQGEMVCGETGIGRMSAPETIFSAIMDILGAEKPLSGRRAIVTAGPTYEPIDPVRFIGNRSSGKQGYAIAQSLQRAGADVTLITGPVNLPDLQYIKTIHVETAQEMLSACEAALPADIAICAAAVSDWRAASPQTQKIKKNTQAAPPALSLTENPDILHHLSTHKTQRPELVIGFAAESENLIQHAQDKLKRKMCDWIFANDVCDGNTFGADDNHVYMIDHHGAEEWEPDTKDSIANKLTHEIETFFKK